MKKYLLLALLLISTELMAGCDMCTMYLGMHPNQTKNSVGLRYRMSSYSLASAHNHNHGAESQTSTNKELRTFQTTELWAQFMLSSRWQIIAIVPYSMNSVEQNNLVIDSYNNFGDVQIINRYQIYRSGEDEEFQKQLSLGLGIKAPTGVYTEKSRAGALDQHIQNGTGSWDVLFNTSFLIKNERYGFNQEFNLKVNSSNKNDYKFANRYSSASSVFLFFKIKRVSIQPSLTAMIEYADYDQSQGNSVYFSNGASIYAQSGIDIYYKKFIININSAVPMYEKLNDAGAENIYRMGLGINYIM